MTTFGEKLRALMAERQISQRKLAKRVPCDGGHLSKIVNGRKNPSPELAQRLDELLDADGELVTLARARRKASQGIRSGGGANGGDPDDSTIAPLDLLSLAWTVGRLDQGVDRRSVLQLAPAVAAAPALGVGDPIERITRALTRPTSLGEDVVTHLEARCIGFHRLECVFPAKRLFRALLAHLNEITSLLEAGAADRWRMRLARIAGESAVLGAWLAWELGDVARSSALYRVAELAARESGDPVIRACSAIYQSFALSEVVGHHAAFRTLEGARSLVPDHGDLATRAWLMGRRAEEAAALGDISARRLIEEASALMADARPQSERSWTRCLESPRMSHMRLTIATRLGDARGVHAELDELLMLANDPAQKRTGRMLATIGLALTRMGDADEGVRFGERAVEAVRVSEAAYATSRLTELGDALRDDVSARSRELRAAIGVTCRDFASPRPSTAGTTPNPS
ncbi:helix-turn-helix domain-containing protein [Actinomadura formosensis]|uniref:helix-turn-helix domain-containing protein n=1 Tax=Actinomadura formosensis TaxID=60706 RepID=UPI003D94AD1C